jgi:hypothetical protein
MEQSNEEKLKLALSLCDKVIELLDEAYVAHCKETGIEPSL